MADLTTREASDKDLEFAWQVYSESVRPLMSEYLEREWDDKLERTNFEGLWTTKDTHIVSVDGVPVGWFSITIEGDSVEIDHGYLLVSHQRKGIGSIISDFVFQEAKKRGLKVVKADLLKNSPASAFFEKLGFVVKDSSDPMIKKLSRNL